MRKPSRPIVGTIAVFLAMFLLYMLASCAAPAPGPLPAAVGLAQPAAGQYLCTLDSTGGGFRLVCDPAGEPTPTLAPTRTPTAEPPTATPEPPPNTPEPTSTPEPPEAHDTGTWHPAGGEENGYMHHGVSWDETLPGMQAFLLSLVDQGVLSHWNAIGNQWQTSPNENVFPCDEGTYKHCGFVNLYIPDTGCANERNRSGLCVKEAFMQQHANPTLEEARMRFHSQWIAALVCDRETQSQCDYVFSGGRPDYAVFHNGYKDAICQLETNPAGWPPDQFNPPYATGHQNSGDVIRPDLNPHYWNSKTIALTRPFIGEANWVIQAEWSELNSFEYQDIDHCAEPEFDIAPCPDGTCDYDGTRYQWFSLLLNNLPAGRPYNEFHDANGVAAPGCEVLTRDCIPLIIGAGVPAGDFAFFEHLVQQGGLNGPQFDFGPGDPVGLFRMPGS